MTTSYEDLGSQDLQRFASQRDEVNTARAETIHRIASSYCARLLSAADVLEYGCNTGAACCQMARHGHRVTGVDVDARLLETARTRYKDGDLRYVLVEGRLPFADRSFDFVFSSEVIEHVPASQQELYFREFRRVLRDDGVGYLSYPNFWYPVEQHYRKPFHHWVQRLSGRPNKRYERIPSKYAVRRRLARDFEVVDVAQRFLMSAYTAGRYGPLTTRLARWLGSTPFAPQDYLVLLPRKAI